MEIHSDCRDIFEEKWRTFEEEDCYKTSLIDPVSKNSNKERWKYSVIFRIEICLKRSSSERPGTFRRNVTVLPQCIWVHALRCFGKNGAQCWTFSWLISSKSTPCSIHSITGSGLCQQPDLVNDWVNGSRHAGGSTTDGKNAQREKGTRWVIAPIKFRTLRA